MIDRHRPIEKTPGPAGAAVTWILLGGLLVLVAPGSDRAQPEGWPTPGPGASPAGTEGGAPEAVPADDPTRTAGGALAVFMSRRGYRTIRELKAVMTPDLQARYDHDSVPFNGKKRVRIALFNFSEKDLKPVPTGGKTVKAAKPGGATATAGGAAAAGVMGAAPGASVATAPAGPSAYVATVRSLWEDQGEAVELRVESIKVVQTEDGLWRVSTLDRVSSDPLRFKDAVPGVTALRLILRAWVARDPAGARPNLGQGFLRKYEGRDAALRDLFVGAPDPRHAAFQVLDMKPEGATAVIARVRLFEAFAGRPSPPEGSEHTLRLVKKGPPWLLDAWD